MLSIHSKNGISKTPDAAKAVFAALCNISSAFDGIESIVENMSAEGQERAIAESESFLKARTQYYATMKRLGLDDGPEAA